MSDDQIESLTLEAATQGYDKDFIGLVEMIYGKGFLSQGGERSVQEMIGDLNLDAAQVLDIGSGLGGPSIYLAKRYQAHVTGLEPQAWMIECAHKNLVDERTQLRGSVNFVHMAATSNLKQFASGSFDFVLSKEAILHIPLEVKQSFLAEIFRVLKPGGMLIVLDWVRTGVAYSANTTQMMELDGVAYNLTTRDSYLASLAQAGFSEISSEDRTEKSVEYSQLNLESIHQLKDAIIDLYGVLTFDHSLQSWSWQRDAFKARELETVLFKAKKPLA